ncbi:hypothetical protein Pth03_46170 [Planotetraspora thailandica]|uniref:Uncharacterized protein n=1 Tax=Planotetraspora thailandica TaxID=487172 RepID=A0A8J3V3R4_9ACTN|nr:hypothetical protein [Planotetraspora thailandica]GII56228.1 hypothetical protein Pth03_46170 [Planotetraspora thailandica]
MMVIRNVLVSAMGVDGGLGAGHAQPFHAQHLGAAVVAAGGGPGRENVKQRHLNSPLIKRPKVMGPDA